MLKIRGKFLASAFICGIFIMLPVIADAATVKWTVKLAVPFHHQQHGLSCEAAALTMALNYKGIKVTENKLISQLPFSALGPRQADNTWGDPSEGFVGDINGRMPNTGYGVYEEPILNLALKYRQAKIIRNGTIADLIDAVDNKNVVIAWGVIGKGRDISWKTVAGYEIKARMNEHTRVIIGYSGKADNPKMILLLDPVFGKIKMTTADFLKNWELMDKRAVVID